MSIPNTTCRLCAKQLPNVIQECFNHLQFHACKGDFKDQPPFCLLCPKKKHFFGTKEGRLLNSFKYHLNKYHHYDHPQLRNSTSHHDCQICNSRISLSPSSDFEEQNMALLKDHYLTHFPYKPAGTTDGPSAGPSATVIPCIFKKACSLWWTTRRRVQQCFNTHKYLAVPSVISIINYSPSGDLTGAISQPDGDNSDGEGEGGDSDPEQPNQDENFPESHVFEGTGERKDNVEMGETLDLLYGSLRYIYRVQQEAINLVATQLKELVKILRNQIINTIEDVCQKTNLGNNNDLTHELKNEINKILMDPFFNQQFGSNYRREQTFQETEEIIEPMEWQIDKELAPNDTVIVFDIVKQMRRFLESEGIAPIWQHAKNCREINNRFNEECLARGDSKNQRYHTIYDGRRIKEKIAQLPQHVSPLVVSFFVDDFGIDSGYTKNGSKHKGGFSTDQ